MPGARRGAQRRQARGSGMAWGRRIWVQRARQALALRKQWLEARLEEIEEAEGALGHGGQRGAAGSYYNIAGLSGGRQRPAAHAQQGSHSEEQRQLPSAPHGSQPRE